jgi:hypothetical protein
VRQALMRAHKLVFATLFLLTSACVVTHDEDIAGTYIAKTPCATITLAVSVDHTFVQRVRTFSGETNELRGKWAVDVNTGWTSFEPFLGFSRSERGERGTGYSAKVERLPEGLTMGPMIITCPDSAHEVNYVKR